MAQKNTAKSKSGKRRKRTLEEITIAGGREEKRYSKALKNRRELDLINGILRSPDSWLKRVELRKPGAEIRELLEALQKRKTELQKTLHRGENPFKFAQPFQMRPQQQIQIPISLQRALANQYQFWVSSVGGARQGCPFWSMGQVPASDFREYKWAGVEVNNARTSNAYWPLSQSNVFAQTTFTGNWAGETGANFWGWLFVPANVGFDLWEFVATAGVLQFTIPAPQCDSILNWWSGAVAEAPTSWFIDADNPSIDTSWVLHESPEGGGFPASILSFQFFAGGLWKDDNPANTVTSHRTTFARSFEVKAGVSPRIYLGLSLGLAAAAGEVSTIKEGGLGDHFRFEPGITYSMVTQNP